MLKEKKLKNTRMPKDFSLCKVYKVESKIGAVCYVGSTCQKYLSSRMNTHRTHYKHKHTYCSSFEVMKYPDAEIILLKAYPECSSWEEQRMFEREWQDQIKCVNHRRAYITDDERVEENKARNSKRYYENHEEELKKFAEYRKNRNEEEKKDYRSYMKSYYEKHKTERIHCDVCNIDMNRWCFTKHKNSKAHKLNDTSIS